MTIYKGFSTIGNAKKFRVTDLDLVKRDLINHFRIRKGEKLMHPDFGSIIWNVLFEPLTESLRQVVLNDVATIVKYDPRIVANEILLDEFQNGLRVRVALTYIPTNQTATMLFTFDRDSGQVS